MMASAVLLHVIAVVIWVGGMFFAYMALRPVAARWYEPFLGYARWFYGGDGFTAWQLFWPEDDGVMPWDEGASEWLRENQPRLYATRVGEAGVEALLASM